MIKLKSFRLVCGKASKTTCQLTNIRSFDEPLRRHWQIWCFDLAALSVWVNAVQYIEQISWILVPEFRQKNVYIKFRNTNTNKYDRHLRITSENYATQPTVQKIYVALFDIHIMQQHSTSLMIGASVKSEHLKDTENSWFTDPDLLLEAAIV